MNEEIGKTVKLILVWLLLYIAATFIAAVIGGVVKSYEITKWTIVLGYMLVAILFFGKHYVELSFGRIERRMVWPVVGMSVLIAVSQAFVLFSASSLLDVELQYQGEELERRQQLFSGIAGALYCCVMGPIIEEIGFRGLILGGLLKMRCRPWIAILISALVFALLHGFGAIFVTAVLFGILVGWLYWRTGSIIPGIIIHIVNNSLTAIDLIGQSHVILWLILVVGLLLLAYCLWWFGKKFSYKNLKTIRQ
jgi:membrane protease YdiL (CAAX protease family)